MSGYSAKVSPQSGAMWPKGCIPKGRPKEAKKSNEAVFRANHKQDVNQFDLLSRAHGPFLDHHGDSSGGHPWVRVQRAPRDFSGLN